MTALALLLMMVAFLLSSPVFPSPSSGSSVDSSVGSSPRSPQKENKRLTDSYDG
jgi:hypothetical protein